MKTLLTLILIFINAYVFSQNQVVDTISPIPFKVETYPYIIKDARTNIESNIIKGRALLCLFINKKAKIIGFNIDIIDFINTKTNKSIRFKISSHKPIQLVEYPNHLNEIYYLFEKYVKSIIIMKNSNYLSKEDINDVNYYRVYKLIRFGKINNDSNNIHQISKRILIENEINISLLFDTEDK